MNGAREAATLLLVAALVALAGNACGDSGSPAPAQPSASVGPQSASEKLSVVTTIYVMQYLAQEIGGERVHVTNLTPPGALAHDWEPTPRTVSDIGEADVFVYNGSGLEPWVDRALASLALDRTVVLDATDALAPSLLGARGDSDGAKDPHVWLDPSLYSIQARLVKDVFATADPEGEALYSANLAAFQERLSTLEQEWERALASCSMTTFVTNHAAFGYLANRFGLEQVAISGLSPETEPSPARLKELIEKIRGLGIKYIFFEPLASARVAETLAREVVAETLSLNPLEGLTSQELESGQSYFTVMRANLKNLQKALECQ